MRIVVASSHPGQATCLSLREHFQAFAHDSNPAMLRLENFQERLSQIQPDILAIVLSPNPELALPSIAQARASFDGQILAIGPGSEAKVILRALQAGADHYLDEADLENGLEGVLRRLQVKEPAGGGQLIAVLPCCGGCGATTLAVNIAVLLSKEHKRCALVDLTPGADDVAALLNLRPNYTIADLCSQGGRIDQTMFDRSLIRHPSGVHLLGAPQKVRDVASVKPHTLLKSLSLARASFPQIVVDLQDCHHEEQIAVLKHADRILVVFRLDFTSLRNARRTLPLLDGLGISRQRLQLVVTRVGQSNELPLDQAEEALGLKITHAVPDDPKSVNHSNNIGVPVVLEAPMSKAAKAFAQIATSFDQSAPARSLSWPAVPAAAATAAVGLTSRLQMLFGQ